MLGSASMYKKAEKYWANIPATLNGVLGGYGHITDIDINGSKQFLNKILNLEKPPDTKLALDCGAGIGRVSKDLLMHYFLKVDLVEQDQKFINTAKQLFQEDNGRVGTLYQISLQCFNPEKLYDVIWCQWVLGNLNDRDLIAFLIKCKEALSENGVIILKENVSEILEYDDVDSSYTRPLRHMANIFNKAKLQIIHNDIQTGFPENIFPVHMIALKPLKSSNCNFYNYFRWSYSN